MKILNLILYNKEPIYDEMLEIQRSYLKNISNITYYFYCYDEHIDKDYLINDDIIYIKGKETFLPGILKKTIDAIKITMKIEYDYLIRSNISTIIEFELLAKILGENIFLYTGGHLENLQWIDITSGIINHNYRGLLYIQGTAIILSKLAVDILIENENDIDYSIIDDVSIGIFYKKFNIIPKSYDDYYVVNSKNAVNNKIFYRNKYGNRILDITNMKNITDDILLNKNQIHNSKITKCLYGKNETCIDVTDKFINLFVHNNFINIKSNTNFNNFFGDPLYGVVKEITIYLNNNTIIINEHINNDLVIEL